jgi:HEAT repeat protein
MSTENMHASTLKELAGSFSANRIMAARAIRELRETDPRAFLEGAVQILRESAVTTDGGENPGAKYLLSMLLARPDALECICDPELFSGPESLALIHQAKTLEPQLETSLARLAARLPFDTERQANLGTRVLEVLAQISDPTTALPALRQLLECSNARMRSKAALLFGRISRNPKWAKLADPDEDQRVIANSIESLWGLDSEAAKDVFREAVQDSRNRIVGNGAMGLYMAGDLAGAAALFRLSRDEEWVARSTASWCMGRAADARFLPRLGKLIKDPAPGVRTTAFRGVGLVNQRVKSFRNAGMLALKIREASYREGKQNLQVVVGDGGPETRGFGALAFVVSSGDEVVEQFSLEQIDEPPLVIYQITYDAPEPEARIVKVELLSERGCGGDSSPVAAA